MNSAKSCIFSCFYVSSLFPNFAHGYNILCYFPGIAFQFGHLLLNPTLYVTEYHSQATAFLSNTEKVVAPFLQSATVWPMNLLGPDLSDSVLGSSPGCLANMNGVDRPLHVRVSGTNECSEIINMWKNKLHFFLSNIYWSLRDAQHQRHRVLQSS